MSPGKLNGWKFVHPDLVETGAEKPAGLVLTHHHGVGQVSDDEAVRQGILMLLSTRPGERVMRPDYGCNLHQLIFSPNDDTTAGLAIHLVRTALTKWEPRIDICELDANPDPEDPAVLVISLKYQVRLTKKTDEIQLSLPLNGEVSDVTANA